MGAALPAPQRSPHCSVEERHSCCVVAVHTPALIQRTSFCAPIFTNPQHLLLAAAKQSLLINSYVRSRKRHVICLIPEGSKTNGAGTRHATLRQTQPTEACMHVLSRTLQRIATRLQTATKCRTLSFPLRQHAHGMLAPLSCKFDTCRVKLGQRNLSSPKETIGQPKTRCKTKTCLLGLNVWQLGLVGLSSLVGLAGSAWSAESCSQSERNQAKCDRTLDCSIWE